MSHLLSDLPRAVLTLLSALVILSQQVDSTAQEPAGGGPVASVPRKSTGPLKPEMAARSIQLEPGVRVELVAAEPLTASPVAITFDAAGRLFVAENRGYPTGPGPGDPPAGRIALLEDTDGDGRMDRRVVFADNLTYPNGLMPWKGGLIVTCAPDILYLRDTNDDGKADERHVLFTGFSTSGSTQLRVSHPTLSLDNWIYVTSGLTGGRVVSPSHPDRPAVELGRTDFRFRPDGDSWEAADGGSQFGLAFDDFGRRFICYNRVQVQHVVIGAEVLRRNPFLAFAETVQDCPAEMMPEPLKGHGAAARLYPISHNVTTADSHAGTFTAACAVTVYRGDALPSGYRGAVFSCDPTGNLVHVDRLVPRGATFSALRERSKVEFLASSDDWFRPVFLANGPEGALYIVDMYRKTIEHPDYLPVEIRKRTDFESGRTMGRIWRVVGSQWKHELLTSRPRPGLAGQSIETLCSALRDFEGWRQDTAHRLLLERRDPASIRPLRLIAEDPEASPTAIVHALRLLEALESLPDDSIRSAINHSNASVREQGVQLAEARLAAHHGLMTAVLPLADDRDARVRFQVAITLGVFKPAAGESEIEVKVTRALARIALRGGTEKWTRAAVLSALRGREMTFLGALTSSSPPDLDVRLADRGQSPMSSLGQSGAAPVLPMMLAHELGRLLGLSQPREAWPRVVGRILEPKAAITSLDRAALITGLAEAARSRLKGSTEDIPAAVTGPDTSALTGIRRLLAEMRRVVADPGLSMEARSTGIGLLAFDRFEQAGDVLLGLMTSEVPLSIQVAAVRALGAQRDYRVAEALLESGRFAAYAPAVREDVIATLVARSEYVPTLLTAIEKGSVPSNGIDTLRRQQLTQHRDQSLRQRAVSIFGTVHGDRAKVYEAYKDVVALEAEAQRGNAVFRRECASCHRLDQEGTAVGPDLFGIRNQPKESILLHILVPDHEISQGFTAYTIATRDGRMLTGLITAESPAGITLRQQQGKEDTLLRSEIEEIAASRQSLMPQGLEKSISRQEFADLLAYLKGEGKVDRPILP